MRLSGIVQGSGIFVFLMGLPVFSGPIHGIQNFWQIDDHVYRGAQPTDEGFRNLAKLGIRTVIDLRAADGRSTAEEKTVTAAGMRYVSVPMTGLTPPTSEQITKILTMLQDASVGPVFVHWKRGQIAPASSWRFIGYSMTNGKTAVRWPKRCRGG